MAASGIPVGDYYYVYYIIQHESGWSYISRNQYSGAYGLCQSLPASKMATAGGDYLSDPLTQLRWCNQYALGRYGGWYQAYLHEITYSWW